MIPMTEQEVISPYDDHGKLNDLGKELFRKGVEVLRSRKNLGVVILSGGEGTRLGLTYPKGLFKIEGSTLFEWHLKRLQIVYDKYKSNLYLFVMTSESTDKKVREYFANQKLSFLKGVEIFKQSSIEALDMATKKVMMREGKPVMNPVGNGDFFDAVLKTKTLEKVEALNVVSVDNVMANILDEVYVGAFFSRKLEILSKAVKALKGESVGAFFMDGEHIRISEYSEKTADSEDAVYGNICNHMFTRELVKRVGAEQLPLHQALKKIEFTDDRGVLVKPTKPNGIKREKFIFDSFEFSTRNGVMCVPREFEFSPLKNSTENKTDNQHTCSAALKSFRMEHGTPRPIQ